MHMHFKYCYKVCIQRKNGGDSFLISWFASCQSALLSTVISFVYKDKWWFDESMSVIFCIQRILEKELLYSLSTLILQWIKLENFVMQLKRQSVESGRMKSIIQKGIIPERTQSPDKKFSYQSTVWITKARSGHICCLCSFLVELSSCRVTKATIGHRFF